MNKKFKISIQTSVILLLFFLIIPLSSLIMLITYFTSADSVSRLSASLMESIASQTIDKSLNYLSPARRGLDLSRGLAKADIIKSEEFEEVERYFRQLLDQYPEFIMLNYGVENGNFMMVKRMPDNSYSTKWISRQEKWAVTKWIHDNPVWEKNFKNIKEDIDKAYDPRKRPWYIKAKTQGRAVWTDAYIFFSDRKPGISCASPIYSFNKDELTGVVGVDMGIEELSNFIGRLEIGKHGKAFIINQKGELIAYPVLREEDIAQIVQEKVVNGQTKIVFQPVLGCSDQALVSSYKALTADMKNSDNFITISQQHPVRFKHNKETYIGTYKPFPKDSDWQWIIGVIAPENDFMGDIKKNNIITIVISLSALVISLIVGIFLTRRITKPLKTLSDEAMYIRDLNLTPRVQVASNLVEIMNMAESFENMKKGLRSFEKYVPSELVRMLLKNQSEADLGVKKQELTILFSDIQGFTSISEKLDPELLVRMLGEYLNELSTIIHKQYGTVDKYIGDAIMAFWGAPRIIEQHAVQACRAALLCNEKLKELNKKWSQAGKPVLNTRFGINTGVVLVGNIGCDTRMDYTIIGDHVNLASRLEGINKVYGTNIIISGNTAKLIKDVLAFRLLDFVAVAGKSEPTAIYELICEKDKLDKETILFIKNYSFGIKHYKKREWAKALSLFEYAAKLRPDDKPSKLLHERCEQYAENPPPDDWTGVFVLKGK
ncbi:Adenylate and guanylate cyclase catalytic domain-containing protein [Desulfonema limicola]|uniref:Adenylate and guanylate cyclase catalytic domain-containing protein n=1 Tax=Desulfonema limicola TaxID=45656 RepID=A0A975GHB0_9BACT|nr:adenylate/guanylate cyclase domain-containing protein [Desulfonema limicola]QTA81132.1 Adenylate and guanylate cyclase catalytic domain-containing protein [Desulfonema limicola]